MDNQTDGNTNWTQQQGMPQQPQTQGAPPSWTHTSPQWTGQSPQVQGMPQYHAFQEQRPRRRFRNAMKTMLTTVSFIKGMLVIILILSLIAVVGSLADDSELVFVPSGPRFSVIRIEGAIVGERGFADYGYDHQATLGYIKSLADDMDNKGILLYMNTPGGTVYHSDELYLALLDYKKDTGRPVHAYMSEMCASGGYYISMASDYITANRITITGSIGVISTMIDTSGLFEELGLRTVVIDSGEHKGAGSLGVEITPRQQAVYRSIIDEYFELFVSLIADGRSMDIQTVKDLADGRIYTAQQAYQQGLIDEVGSWDGALSGFEELTGAVAYFPNLHSEMSFLEQVFARVPGVLPANEADFALSRLTILPTGVPLAIAPELLGWNAG
jgi:protease-4